MMTYFQSLFDIFLIDWEKPAERGLKVSVWRSWLIGREWNDLQVGQTFDLLLCSLVLESLFCFFKCGKKLSS